MLPPTPTSRRHPWVTGEVALYLGVAFATTLAHSPLTSLPFETAAITEGLGLSPSAAGFLATLQLSAYAVTNIVISPFMGRSAPRRAALVGALLAVAASIACATTRDLGVFGFSRVLAGVGFGIVFSCANAAGARARVPERAYSIGMGVSIVFFTILPIVLAQSMHLSRLGSVALLPHAGVFIAITALTILLIPALCFLPDTPPNTVSAGGTVATSSRRSVTAAVGSLAVMLCFSIAVFSLYAFLEHRGRSLGMNASEIGTLLGATIGIGMLGTFASTWLGRRNGMALPLVSALALQGISCLAVAGSASPPQLWMATSLFLVLWYFVYPYIMGLGASIDPAGRLPTALGGAYLVGSSVAASAGGLLLQKGGFVLTGILGCALCFTAALIALGVSQVRAVDTLAPRRVPQHESRSTEPQ
jgi:predicted MFS family arabinose efflux permease